MINAVISEFNPFHNGHRYLLKTAADKTGADATVCFMSGNFVQRGEPAISDKHTRTAVALAHGADLVIQIPTAHSLASAELFARSGVFMANALGVDTTLCFGSESDDITPLLRLADAPKDLLAECFRKNISMGMSYASAAARAYSDCTGEDASILSTPNNLLAFEYIKAIKSLDAKLGICNVQRKGTDHDSDAVSENFASASYIRKNGGEGFVPSHTPVRLDYEKYETHLLFSLYKKSAQDLSSYADMSEGLENRFENAAKTAKSINELLSLVKTKRYTHAKLSRAAVNAFLEIPKQFAHKNPPYLKVLGFNDKGRALLKTLADTATLPIIIKPTDAKDISPEFFEIECRASDIYDYVTKNPKGKGTEFTISPIYKK